jgi:16S rRNA (guanine527-N7)-methyltransferase
MAAKNFSYDDFLPYVSVSRETFQRLTSYVELIEKWQKTINLIGSLTIPEIWLRHVIDSAQLFAFMNGQQKIVDLGSGAGFPGLVLAIMGNEQVTLVESDGRKAVFLKEAARVTHAPVIIEAKRVDAIDLNSFSFITARGFAPIPALLRTLQPTLNTNHKLLLLKGKRYFEEIQEARRAWNFDYETYPSITDNEGVVLSMQHFKRTEGVI